MGRELIGEGPALARLRRAIAQVAGSDANLLVCGETGTGKGLVARAVHARSRRRARPFVHVDCAALSPTVIESELFGHERGAFTDAVARRVGRLERAAHGTLFLDEIGDLAPPLQAKLLRVLEDREFERVGGGETLSLHARVIAATHHDLAAQVARGRFRSDLLYRLDVLSLWVPPLRERLDDLSPLVAAQLRRLGRGRARFAPEALRRLAAHDWPGNVRELANVVERCVTFAPGETIGSATVERTLTRTRASPAAPRPEADPEASVAGPRALADREAIAAALRASGGNVRRAARRLGLPRSTLRYRIQRLRLEGLLMGPVQTPAGVADG